MSSSWPFASRPVRAAVQRGDRQIAIEQLALPERLDEDCALLKVTANGLCGTDYEQYVGALNDAPFVNIPCVPGHEPVGNLAWIGPAFPRADLAVGDSVVLESTAPCGECSHCLAGRVRACPHGFIYGFTSLSVGSGLWGGLAEYLVLKPRSVLHRVPPGVSAEQASLANALGAGFDWVGKSGLLPGDRVLVFGAGQRGIACAVAASAMGASQVIITGLEQDAHKLEVALAVGATHAVDASRSDVVSAVREITGGAMVDVAIDVTPFAMQPVADGIEALRRKGGTFVLAGLKGNTPYPKFVPDKLVNKAITLRGVSGTGSQAYARALATIGEKLDQLRPMLSHRVPLEAIDQGLRLLGGEVKGVMPIHITVVPA